jgi:hypothetical protein
MFVVSLFEEFRVQGSSAFEDKRNRERMIEREGMAPGI